MKPTHRAIVLLQIARDLIEQDAHHTDPFDGTRRDDLNDIADDIGTALYHLESFEGTP
jgi:hypothetical protein